MKFFHVERHLSDPLDGIGVKEDSPPVAEGGDLFDRVNRPDLVVREHESHEDRLFPQNVPDLINVDSAESVGSEVAHLKTFAVELLARVEHRLVLGRAGDDVVSLLAVEAGDAEDREVVRFGRAGSEDDLLGRGAEEFRDFFTRAVDGGFRLPAVEVISRGRVPERSRQIRHHRFEDARVNRGRRVVVHVDRGLHRSLTDANSTPGEETHLPAFFGPRAGLRRLPRGDAARLTAASVPARSSGKFFRDLTCI